MTTLVAMPEQTKVRRLNALRSALRARFFAVFLILVAVFVYFAVTQEQFLTVSNMNSMLTSTSTLWMAAIGMTFVMLVGAFDLSLGALVGINGVVLGLMFNTFGLPIEVAVLLTIAGGFVIGVVANGILIGQFGLSFLIVTLGTSWLLSGLVSLFTDSKTEPLISPWLDTLAFGRVAGIPVPVVVMIGVFAASWVVLNRTLFGRDIYSIGGNPQAARLSGINVRRTVAVVFGVAGLMAALSAIMQVSRIAAVSPQVNSEIMFQAAAAVLLGGASFVGGGGTITGTAVGVLFLGVMSNGLGLVGAPSYWQHVITGSIVLIAGVLDFLQGTGAGPIRKIMQMVTFRRTRPRVGERSPIDVD
ncbi:ABC transporter permease subunit [Nocardia sp. R6R-6]|uniref:ABC transporter permease subunit n=1 Tax=Nocardia sp. R6R-6 TaxID=3459303 RepID=UPI00403D5679